MSCFSSSCPFCDLASAYSYYESAIYNVDRYSKPNPAAAMADWERKDKLNEAMEKVAERRAAVIEAGVRLADLTTAVNEILAEHADSLE